MTALFVPKTFHAKRSTVINKPKQEVFEYVKLIKNQENYGVWFRMDPAIEKTYEGTDGTVGFVYTWKSKEVGNGKQVLTKIDEGNRIDMDLFFQDSNDAAKLYMTTESINDNQTKVTWVIDGKMPYPFNLMGVFYNMNKDFEQGVQNLKEVLEKE
ncbi:MAG TPA: SRPBCC family protein [Flavobacterium sp.]|nr:SRPBCC family protein [Flavobacterium sp.]